jgi:hypothetical protein
MEVNSLTSPYATSHLAVYSPAMQKLPAGFECEECRRLARALQVAWRVDNQALQARLRDVAVSSGRDLRQFGVGWVFSVATMPDDEMRVLLKSHYPTVAEAKRRGEEHETASGHCLRAWWMLLQYSSDEPE